MPQPIIEIICMYNRIGGAILGGSYGPIDEDYLINLENSGIAFIHTDSYDFRFLVCHEFGHAFAALFEEYVDRPGQMEEWEIDSMKEMQTHMGWFDNVSFTSDPNTIGWSRFISDARHDESKVSIIEGARYSNGIWRSVYDSMMGRGGEFSVPAREAIYKTIHKRAYGKDWHYDYETFVQQDLKNIQPDSNTTASAKSVPSPARVNKKSFLKIDESTTPDGKKMVTVIMN